MYASLSVFLSCQPWIGDNQPDVGARRAVMRIFAFLLIAIGVMLASPIYAADITVDGTTCTLADAITASNSDTATGGCSAGNGLDTITIQQDVILDAPLPAINSDLLIQGDDPARYVSGTNTYRVFLVNSGNVTFQTLTIQDGRDGGGTGGAGHFGGGGGLGAGGGLFIENGAVTIQGVTFTNNQAFGGTGGAADDFYNMVGGNGGGSTNNPAAGAVGAEGNGTVGSFGGGGAGHGANGDTGGTGGFGSGGGGGWDSGGGGWGGGAGFGGGGGGAGLGGAIFIRTGNLTVSNSSFTNNQANGGAAGAEGWSRRPSANGNGYGGAIFICTATEDASCGTTVTNLETLLSTNTFTNNSTNSANLYNRVYLD